MRPWEAQDLTILGAITLIAAAAGAAIASWVAARLRARTAREDLSAARNRLEQDLSAREGQSATATLDAAAADSRASEARDVASLGVKALEEFERGLKDISSRYKKMLAIGAVLIFSAGATVAQDLGPCLGDADLTGLVDQLERLAGDDQVGAPADGARALRLLQRKVMLLCTQRDALDQEVRALRDSLAARMRLLDIARQDLDAYRFHLSEVDRLVPRLRSERWGWCAGVGGGITPEGDSAFVAGALWGLRLGG